MRFTKQLTLMVTGIAMIGLLAGCGSATSAPAKSLSVATTGTASASQTASATTKTSQAAKSQSTAASNQSASAAPGNAMDAKTQFPDTYNPSVVSVLKIDNSTLKKDLQSGKSLADIAKAQGVSEQQVVDALTSNAKKSLDQAVASGKISKTTEEQDLSSLQTQMKQVVEHHNTTK